MADPASYSEAAAKCQVLIHAAAEYSPRYMELDRKTVDTLLAIAEDARQPKLLIYTSGCWLLGNTGETPADEGTPLAPPAMVMPRLETERAIQSRSNVRTIILRPGCVYGGSGSLTATWFDTAEKEGAARIVGDGNFHWTMVHVADLAEAYRLAAESGCTREVFNISDRSRPTVAECARAVSRVVKGTSHIHVTPVAEAEKMIGPLAECLTLDQRVDSGKAERLLGWMPRHTGFTDGVRRYYAAWKASS
jgi:nucleoside-diphosphate-sugar epimerase